MSLNCKAIQHIIMRPKCNDMWPGYDEIYILIHNACSAVDGFVLVLECPNLRLECADHATCVHGSTERTGHRWGRKHLWSETSLDWFFVFFLTHILLKTYPSDPFFHFLEHIPNKPSMLVHQVFRPPHGGKCFAPGPSPGASVSRFSSAQLRSPLMDQRVAWSGKRCSADDVLGWNFWSKKIVSKRLLLRKKIFFIIFCFSFRLVCFFQVFPGDVFDFPINHDFLEWFCFFDIIF